MQIGCVVRYPQGLSTVVCIFLFGHNAGLMLNHRSISKNYVVLLLAHKKRVGTSRVPLLLLVLAHDSYYIFCCFPLFLVLSTFYAMGLTSEF